MQCPTRCLGQGPRLQRAAPLPHNGRRLVARVRAVAAPAASTPAPPETATPKPAAAQAAVEAAPGAVEANAPATAPAADQKKPEQKAEGAPPKYSYGKAVLLQAFGWESCFKNNWYGTILSKVPDIQAAGITHVWLPPPSQSVSPQGYMPGQLYNLTSKYGNKEALVKLNQALKFHGIKPVADIVINHRCADEVDANGVYNRFRDDVTHDGRKIDWGQWAITSNDPMFKGTGNPDTGDDYGPAPDLDHLNDDLRAALKEWMSWLQKDIGFDGWRLDFARGYGSRFVTEYVDSTVGLSALNIGEYWADLKWSGSFLEYNQDESRKRICDWITGNGHRCCAFDFPTKGILQEAVKNVQYDRLRDAAGKAPGLIGWWPSKAVTFVDNHDTGSTQQHWPFPVANIGIGYAYIFTHPGVPCVFWEHLFDWGPDLRKTIGSLAALRARAGLTNESKLSILAADKDMYVARIDDKVMIKMGPRMDMGKLVPKESDGWKFALSGTDWAIWEKKQ